MNNLNQNINLIDINLRLDLTYIDLNQLINQILTNEQKIIEINDIKDYNDKQKIILNIFINQYVHLYPIVSKYNKYNKLLKEDINLLNYKPIFRNFYNSVNIINSSQIQLKDKNIIHIGIVPTFIESIFKLTNKYKKLDFLQIYTSKYEINKDIYNNITNKFDKNNYNLINNITDFYNTDIYTILNNKLLLNKYDLIIFDIYKNIFDFNLEDIQPNINLKYLTSILNSKYIFLQIIFILNKLNIGGDCILLLSGSNHDIYQQFITLLSTLFETILLINSEIDYSYRYYLIGKNYKPKQQLIKELTINISQNKYLINIYDNSNKILDITFDKKLQNKFNNIITNIKYIENIFNNQELIDKIYNNYYYYQLNNTNEWLNLIFPQVEVNKDINKILYKYKSVIISKLKNQQQINEYNLVKSSIGKLEYIGENVDTNTFNKLIDYINYIKLLDIINYKQVLPNIDINILINKYKLDDPLYIEEINLSIFDKLKNHMIIKFNLHTFCPFILSLFYIFNKMYDKLYIIDYNYIYYIILIDINNSKSSDDLFKVYNLNKKKLSMNSQIVIIDEDFILQMNKILNKLFIKQLISNIRLKYLH